MPELFRFYGFVFFFYSREHEPLHVHVEGNDGLAKFVYNDSTSTFDLEMAVNVKAGDLRKIKRIVADNKDNIVRAWHKHFGTDGKDC